MQKDTVNNNKINLKHGSSHGLEFVLNKRLNLEQKSKSRGVTGQLAK